MKITVEQAATIYHLAALHGPGELRVYERGFLDWLWFTTSGQDWCLRADGTVIGWNDVNAVSRER